MEHSLNQALCMFHIGHFSEKSAVKNSCLQ